MRKNTTGHQIKAYADFLRGLEILASVIGGLICFEFNPLLGIIIILVGCFVAWQSTVLLMGYGELIEDTTANREINQKILDILETQYSRQYGEPFERKTASPATWICKKCGTENPFDADRETQFCRECGRTAKVYEKKGNPLN